MLVVGATGSGRTSALAVLAERTDAETRWPAAHPAELWQALEPGSGRRLVLADDLDRTLALADPEQRADLVELLAHAVRDGRRTGLALVASCRSAGGAMHALAAVFEQRLLLRLASREEHLLAGGETRGFDPARRPGSALWRGHEAQLALGGAPPEEWCAALPRVRLDRSRWAIATPRPGEWLARLAAAGIPAGPPHDELARVAVADPDAWLGDYAALATVRREGRMLLIGCTTADHRALARVRAPLPPLGPARDEAWLVEGGTTTRVLVETSGP